MTVDADEEATKTIPLLRVYKVFNVRQCEGLNIEPVQANTGGANRSGPAIVAAMPNPPCIAHDGGDRACYIPARDSIHMPAVDAFEGAGEYHLTLCPTN